MKTTNTLLAGLALLLAFSSPLTADHHAETDNGSALALELAERYGLSSWSDVERIDFTFDVTIGDRRITRPWSWNLEHNTVTANFGQDDAVTFSLDGITEDNRKHHANFINDSYWLLFPFYVVWSDNTVTSHGEHAMPISGAPGQKVTVQYPAEGGYTPGDAYDLYLDPGDGFIREWVFRKGGGDNGRPATWAKHMGLNGLWIAHDHRGPDGSGFRLGFPLVKVYAGGSVAGGEPVD